MEYAKFQHRSPDKITKYTALYLEKLSFCWRQQFARVKVRLHTAINRADFVSWCTLYTYEGNKMHS